MSIERDIVKRPYRIQGTLAYSNNTEFHNANKAYATFKEAEHAAAVQASGACNAAKGNKFIVYKVVALVAPTRPPIETMLLPELNAKYGEPE